MRRIEPAILYFGTPVALLSTMNEDGSANLAPMSSIFWLGWRCVLGLAAASKTTGNIVRTGECVINLPSADMAGHVDRIALTTGANPVPAGKAARGYVYCADKFAAASLTPCASEVVAQPRARECPVQLEARLEGRHRLAADAPGGPFCLEMRVVRVWADPTILNPDRADHIDPDRWRPLIMSFQGFYGLGPQCAPSRLANVPERLYRSLNVDRARGENPRRASSGADLHRAGAVDWWDDGPRPI